MTPYTNVATMAYVKLQLAARAAMARIASDDREAGQTAAEYLGIIVVVVAIIAAIVASGLGDKIASAIGSEIDKITK